MNFINDKYNEIDNFLKNCLEHKNKKIDYILYNPKTKETYVMCSDGVSDAIEFTPYTKKLENGFSNVPEFDYNFDYYIYNQLDNGLKIGYMSIDIHYSIWNSINELYPNDIDNKEGVKYYISYCKANGITKERIDSELNINTPNIMHLSLDKDRKDVR